MKKNKLPRFHSKCKDEKFKTYAVWDRVASSWVEGTEDTDLTIVNQWAEDENDEAAQFDEHIKDTES